jgi:hypothetical protein
MIVVYHYGLNSLSGECKSVVFNKKTMGKAILTLQNGQNTERPLFKLLTINFLCKISNSRHF